MLHCFSCGADLPDNLNFCLHCGERLKDEIPTLLKTIKEPEEEPEEEEREEEGEEQGERLTGHNTDKDMLVMLILVIGTLISVGVSVYIVSSSGKQTPMVNTPVHTPPPIMSPVPAASPFRRR